jgi:DNA excision repair protein ERCC-3
VLISSDNPLIVQSDFTILAEVDAPRHDAAREWLARFAELVKMPEHVHTYRITPLSLWNALSAGLAIDAILAALDDFSRYPVPASVPPHLREIASRFGAIRLESPDGDDAPFLLTVRDESLAGELALQESLRGYLGPRLGPRQFAIEPPWRGPLKRSLMKLGWPVEDRAGFEDGADLGVAMREADRNGRPLVLRDYQKEAVEAFSRGNAAGAGVISLPCGSGKTIIGLACLAAAGTRTLILATGVTAARQWREELLDKTTLTEEDIGEFSGDRKEIRPVTIATYQVLTHRSGPKRGNTGDAGGDVETRGSDVEPGDGSRSFVHFDLFDAAGWGLIIYDEVHLLPAPLFQAASSVQSRRRLGLTATLVREDGLEGDVFALIGPKLYEVPWRELESRGWIAPAVCHEIRLPMPESRWLDYATAAAKAKPRVAAENPLKESIVKELLARHEGEPVLVIGTYIEHLAALAENLGLPLLDGASTQKRRDELFGRFRRGEIRALAVSKIANFSIDLPDASVAIQISGQFGSRQEEAQRLGRLLRPKSGGRTASFYTLVTRDTVEQEYALKRQLFLCEQGYGYQLFLLGDDLVLPPTAPHLPETTR